MREWPDEPLLDQPGEHVDDREEDIEIGGGFAKPSDRLRDAGEALHLHVDVLIGVATSEVVEHAVIEVLPPFEDTEHTSTFDRALRIDHQIFVQGKGLTDG
jgi:hypothetical protein